MNHHPLKSFRNELWKRDRKLYWQTLTALKQSIAHWQRLVIGNSVDIPSREQCALCGKFWKHGWGLGVLCDGCPVKEKTGLDGCEGTPYKQAEDCFNLQNPKDKQFIKYAHKELAFLKSLLPKSHHPHRKPD